MKFPGRIIVLLIAAIALGLAGFGVWYRHRATHRALEFWGAEQAAAIQHSPQVLYKSLAPASEDPTGRVSQGTPPVAIQGRPYAASAAVEVQHVPGVLHLRSYLIENRSFDWTATAAAAAASDSIRWKHWLTFPNARGDADVIISDDARFACQANHPGVGNVQPLTPFLLEVLQRIEETAQQRSTRPADLRSP